MKRSGIAKPFLLACAVVLPGVASSEGIEIPGEVWGFLDKHCLECHDDLTAKGGLDLYALDEAESSRATVEKWSQVFDRILAGEMPPRDQPRPTETAIESFQESMSPVLKKADKLHRQVVHRRLNRFEYENTMRDLLGVSLELSDFLPEDQKAGGFDTNGEALALSAELLQRYLAGARMVLDEVIETGERPESETVWVDSLREVQPYLGKQYAHLEDHVVLFLSNKTQYSKVSTRAHRLPKSGRYRFRFTARTFHSDEPIVFSVVASDFSPVSARYIGLGYFEAKEDEQQFELIADLEEGFAIQFFAHGLPKWIQDPARGENPGVGISAVEITGPMVQEWPPRGHRTLFKEIDLNVASLSDAREILERLMTRAYRRPVSEGEVSRKLRLVDQSLKSGRPFLDSLRVGLEAVLCSPDFLYLVERDSDQIEQFELASRLSYFLWSSMPDDCLLELAAAEKLSDPRTLADQVERMILDEKCDRFVENFTGQWLGLRKIDETTPDSKLYPEYDELLQFSMVEESKEFFRKLLIENLSVSNFVDSDFLLLNNRLAKHYGIEGVSGLEMRSYPIPDHSVRGGVLTQAAVLKVTANGTNTSPVMRGVWVLENVLGKHIPPPPPNIEGIEPDIREATTVREQLDLHRNVESCAGCHQHIDPPGFALESFDPTGAYRENYLQFKVSNAEKGWGRVIDAKEVDASGRTANGEEFSSIRDFKKLILKNKTTFTKTLTERLLVYGLGREMGFSDRAAISEIASKCESQGNGFRTLITEIVNHPIFHHP